MIWDAPDRRSGEERRAARRGRDRRASLTGPTRRQQRQGIAMALPWGLLGAMLALAWGLS